jgi:hypothetical protein
MFKTHKRPVCTFFLVKLCLFMKDIEILNPVAMETRLFTLFVLSFSPFVIECFERNLNKLDMSHHGDWLRV